MAEIKIGRYRHYKGKKYEVLGIAKHSETLEELAQIPSDFYTLHLKKAFANRT